MSRIIEKYPLLTILLACTGLYFLNLGSLQVTIMEARNFVVAREMITEGNWFQTTLNGMARYEKPPLPAWFLTPFIEIGGGRNIIAHRLPTSIMATLGVMIMYLFVRNFTNNKKIALMSSLVLATSFYYIAIRFEAPSDTYAFVFMFAGIYFLYRYLSNAKVHFGYLIMGGICTGLSILSKGPVAPYVLLLSFIPAYFITSKSAGLTKKLQYLIGFFIVALIVGGSWYLFIHLSDPDNFIGIAGKETGNWISYNVKPFYYYWNFFIQTGIWTIPALLSMFILHFRINVKYRSLYNLSWFWTLTALVLLSLIPEKKSRYLVPVLIPLAISTSVYLYYLIENYYNIRNPGKKLVTWLFFGIASFACLAYPFCILFMKLESNIDWVWYILSSILFVGAGLLIIVNIYRKNINNAFYLLVFISMLATGLGMRAAGYMNLNEDFWPLTQFENKDAIPVYYYKKIEPEILWEVGEATLLFSEENILNGCHDKFYILSESGSVEELKIILADNGLLVDEEVVYDRNYYTMAGRRSLRDSYTVHMLFIRIK